MKPAIALLALFVVACGGGASSVGPTGPTGPTLPAAVDGGQWGQRAPLIEPNSELAFAELNGKLYLLGGYPASRQTARTVQIYDIAGNRWELGPRLGQGLSAQMTTVHEVFDAQTRIWTTAAPMLRARSGMNGVMARGCFHV